LQETENQQLIKPVNDFSDNTVLFHSLCTAS